MERIRREQRQGWRPIAVRPDHLRIHGELLADAGVLRESNGLEPTSAATTVRMSAGKTQVLDGPYADSREQLGGFHIIDVADLDAAIAWAVRSPTALHGVVEVRPIRDGSLTTDDVAGFIEPA